MTPKDFILRSARVLLKLLLGVGQLTVILTATLILVGAGTIAYLVASQSCPPWDSDDDFGRTLMEGGQATRSSSPPITKMHLYVFPGVDGKRRDTCDIDDRTPAAIVASQQGLLAAQKALTAEEVRAPLPGDMAGPSVHMLIHGCGGSVTYLIAIANTGQDADFTIYDGMGRFYGSQRLACYFKQLKLIQ